MPGSCTSDRSDARRRHEVVEHVLLLRQDARAVPVLAEFAAAANVGDGVTMPPWSSQSAAAAENIAAEVTL